MKSEPRSSIQSSRDEDMLVEEIKNAKRMRWLRGSDLLIRFRITQVDAISLIMLIAGSAALAVSVFYSSSTVAFIGLGLTFWGAILLYIKPEERSKTLLGAALSPSLTTLNQMIQELGYKGETTYLPPRYFTDPETTRIYVSKRKSGSLPTPEVIQRYENQLVARTTQGMLITPPGVQLSKLLEKSLRKSFIRISLEDLLRKLPKLFIEDLEIAENLEFQREKGMNQNPTIHTRIIKPLYTGIFEEADGSSNTTGSIGGPICSAIAIAITKATGKPVRIVETRSSKKGNTLEVTYEIIEE
jgi:hypothetical protein